jgi:hypothetical protein
MKSHYRSLRGLIYKTAQFPKLYASTINGKFNLKNLSNTVNFDNINSSIREIHFDYNILKL